MKRKQSITFRLTDEEKAKIMNSAKQSNMRVSDFVRYASLKTKMVKVTTVTNTHTSVEVE